MKRDTLKLKKGGIDTIVAYIVVMLPLFYVVVYMVATIYHFSVQTYMNQVLKEATVMVSTYGMLTDRHVGYINEKLEDVLGEAQTGGNNWQIRYFLRNYDSENGIVGPITERTFDGIRASDGISKGDIIGIQVTSVDQSLLGTVGNFNIFSTPDPDAPGLRYSAYREEIIRNERPE